MPHYVKMGKVPAKRHTQFRKEDGSLHYEQVMGTKGFSGIQSLIYHINPPTQVREAKKSQKSIMRLKKKRHLSIVTFTLGKPKQEEISLKQEKSLWLMMM